MVRFKPAVRTPSSDEAYLKHTFWMHCDINNINHACSQCILNALWRSTILDTCLIVNRCKWQPGKMHSKHPMYNANNVNLLVSWFASKTTQSRCSSCRAWYSSCFEGRAFNAARALPGSLVRFALGSSSRLRFAPRIYIYIYIYVYVYISTVRRRISWH